MDEKLKISLIVEEALAGDVGRGKVRIDTSAMRFLDLVSGDPVMITGKYSSVAIVLPLHYNEYGIEIIRMDGWIRRNTGVSIGEKVVVSKAEIKDAEHIVLTPLKSNEIFYNEIFSKNVKNFIRQYLQITGIPLGEGNVVPISMGLGMWKTFVVVQTIPHGFVICSDYTTLEIVYDSKTL